MYFCQYIWHWNGYTSTLNGLNDIFQLKEVTAIARETASDETSTVNLVDSGSTVSGEATLNTVVNSNRVYVNNFAAIADFAC